MLKIPYFKGISPFENSKIVKLQDFLTYLNKLAT